MINYTVLQDKIDDLTRQIDLTKKYLSMKVSLEDWNGVVQVTIDLKDLIARRNSHMDDGK